MAAETSRRARQRQATVDEIVTAAWDLSRRHGLGGIGMRDIAERVGMSAPSLYSYLASKYDIYDAMFLQGCHAFDAWMAAAVDAARATDDPMAGLVTGAAGFVRFCVTDPTRFQLLFQRTIPGFEPSDAGMAVAASAVGRLRELLGSLGVDDPSAIDLWTATLSGLTSQQLANDPGGDRWERLVPRAVQMLVHETAPHLLAPPPAPASTKRRGTR